MRLARCIKVSYKTFLYGEKIALRKSSVNDIDTPCTADGYNQDINTSPHHKDRQNVIGFDENVRTSSAFRVI